MIFRVMIRAHTYRKLEPGWLIDATNFVILRYLLRRKALRDGHKLYMWLLEAKTIYRRVLSLSYFMTRYYGVSV
jgi:hypothetical protein